MVQEVKEMMKTFKEIFDEFLTGKCFLRFFNAEMRRCGHERVFINDNVHFGFVKI
jgi:hypothetical protein